MSGLQSPSVKSEDEFRPEDLDCLSSPNAKRNGYDGIDYDSFEVVSSSSSVLDSPKRHRNESVGRDGPMSTPRDQKVEYSAVPMSEFTRICSDMSPLPTPHDTGRSRIAPVIPTSSDWMDYSALRNGHHNEISEGFAFAEGSPPPTKLHKLKYEKFSVPDPNALSEFPSVMEILSSQESLSSMASAGDWEVDAERAGGGRRGGASTGSVSKKGIRGSRSEPLSPGIDAIMMAAAQMGSSQMPPPPMSPRSPYGGEALRFDDDDCDGVSNRGEGKRGSGKKKKEKEKEKKSPPPVGLGSTPIRIDTDDTNCVTPLSLKPISCNCKRSRCLKLYCDCFRFKKYCGDCNCNDCANLPEYERYRQEAIASILERNPEALKPKIVKPEDERGAKEHLSGCHCKKSNCLKKYCECYTAHVPCSERCRCQDCKNTSEHHVNYQPSSITLAYIADAGDEELTPSVNLSRINMAESFSCINNTPSSSISLQVGSVEHRTDVAVFGSPANSKLFDTAVAGADKNDEDDKMG